MDVFFETHSGSSFCIEVDYWDTTLNIKQKIEKSQGIPVSKQTLFFNGKVLLKDDLDVEQCKILHNSRLEIFVDPFSNPNHNSDQVLHRTEKSSPVTSNSIGDIIYCEDLPLTTQHFSNIRLFSEEVSKIGDSVVRNKDQVLQTEKSPPLNSTEQQIIKGHQDSTLRVQVRQTEKSAPSNSTEQIIKSHQDSTLKVQVLQSEKSTPSKSVSEIIIPHTPAKNWSNKKVSKRIKVGSNNNKNDQVLQPEQSPPSNLVQEIISIQDSPVKVGSNTKNDQVLETEQSPLSNSKKEISKGHQDSPLKPVEVVRSNKKNDKVLETEQSPWKPAKVRMIGKRMTVYVLPQSGENKPPRKIEVGVNTRGNVKELREELVKIEQEGQLKLPQEGYFFVHKQSFMDEDQSFLWNEVNPADTIEIIPGNIRKYYSWL